jgi:sporulation protein YlmC with PRC-barrel domain
MGMQTTTAATATGNRLLSTEDLKSTKVFSIDGKEIGQIDHLMLERESGKVVFAVISFGGFLGLGHSHFPIPWKVLRYDNSHDGYLTNVTEQMLKDAPQFSDDTYGNSDWVARTNTHYGTGL